MTASTIVSQPTPTFVVNAHGNADLQSRLDAAAPLLGALLFGTSDFTLVPPAPIAPAAPALTPDARLTELASDIRVALVAAEAGAERIDWAAAKRAINSVAGYTDRTHTPVDDEGAWHCLCRVSDRGLYGRELDAADIHDALEALSIIADGPASLQSPVACADFEAWCVSRGGSGARFAAPVYAGLRTSRPQPAGCYRATDESSG